MDRNELVNWFVLIAIIIAIVVMLLFVFTVVTDGGQCVLNPAGYYAEVNNITDICQHCKLNYPSFSP